MKSITKSFLSLFVLVFFASATLVAQHNVTGKVVDSSGDPIPGVNVIEKESSSNGTITNIDGVYNLNVKSDQSTLTFSFIGFTQQVIAIDGKSKINIVMVSDITGLDEVVVTALGIKRDQKALGYAVTKIDGDIFVKSPNVNVVNTLAGKSAGVQVDGGSTGLFSSSRITIRGNSSFSSGGNQPIFVVDGVIIENDSQGSGGGWVNGGGDYGNILKMLNPDDFESVSVLKGAASTALYGSRALNGAIVITTKGAKESKGLNVEVNQTVTSRNAYRPGIDFQDTYAGGLGWGYNNGVDDWNPKALQVDDETGLPILRNVFGYSWGPKMEGQEVIDYVGDRVKLSPKPDNSMDWTKAAIGSNTNVVLSGANDKSAFRLSLTNFDTDGTTYRTKLKKKTVDGQFSSQISERIHVRAGVNYVISEAFNPPLTNGYDYSIGQNFLYRWSRDFDTKKFFADEYIVAPVGGIYYNYNKGTQLHTQGMRSMYNTWKDERPQTEWQTRINATITGEITKDLNIVLSGNMLDHTARREFKDYSMNLRYENGGHYYIQHTKKNSYTLQSYLMYDKQFEDFNINARAGIERYFKNSSDNGASTRGGLTIPNGFYLDNSKEEKRVWGGFFGNEYLMNSTYGMANVSYKDMLYVDVTGRNDWVSTMTYLDGSGTVSFFYPSVSASWIFTEVLPIYNVDYGKLRFSYGVVGNAPGAYSIYSGFGYRSDGNYRYQDGTEVPKFRFNGTVLPDFGLLPEKKHSIEAGIEIYAFNKRIGLDATVYRENTINQIMTVATTGESGLSSRKINAGDIQNQGLEIEMTVVPIRTNDIEWELYGNFGFNRSKIKELDGKIDTYQLSGGYDAQLHADVGEPWGTLYTTRGFKYDDSGNKILKWIGGDRTAVPVLNNEKTKLGTITPKATGGFGTSIRYKNLSLSSAFSYRVGGLINSFSLHYGMGKGLLQSSVVARDTETGGMTFTDQEGHAYDDGVIPKGVFEDGTTIEGQDVSGLSYRDVYELGLISPSHSWAYMSDHYDWSSGVSSKDTYIRELSYISWDNVTLSYNLPTSMANTIGMQRASVSIFAQDVLYLYNSLPDNMNPKLLDNTNSYAYSESGLLPYMRTIGFRVNLKF